MQYTDSVFALHCEIAVQLFIWIACMMVGEKIERMRACVFFVVCAAGWSQSMVALAVRVKRA